MLLFVNMGTEGCSKSDKLQFNLHLDVSINGENCKRTITLYGLACQGSHLTYDSFWPRTIHISIHKRYWFLICGKCGNQFCISNRCLIQYGTSVASFLKFLFVMMFEFRLTFKFLVFSTWYSNVIDKKIQSQKSWSLLGNG